jgi:putative lipase involved disintegration of autophagic bodies
MCSCRICNGNKVRSYRIAAGASRVLTVSFHRCHLGKTIFYDTVSNLSWSVDIRTHAIIPVIDKILSEPWAPSLEVGREVPESKFDDDCVVSEISTWYRLGI